MHAAAKIALVMGFVLLLSGCFYPAPGYYGAPVGPYAYPQGYGEFGFGYYGGYGGGRGYDHGGYGGYHGGGEFRGGGDFGHGR